MAKRFPDFEIQEIQQLKENSENQETKKSTSTWLNVGTCWAEKKKRKNFETNLLACKAKQLDENWLIGLNDWNKWLNFAGSSINQYLHLIFGTNTTRDVLKLFLLLNFFEYQCAIPLPPSKLILKTNRAPITSEKGTILQWRKKGVFFFSSNALKYNMVRKIPRSFACREKKIEIDYLEYISNNRSDIGEVPVRAAILDRSLLCNQTSFVSISSSFDFKLSEFQERR